MPPKNFKFTGPRGVPTKAKFSQTLKNNKTNPMTFDALSKLYQNNNGGSDFNVLIRTQAKKQDQSLLCQCLTPFLHYTIITATFTHLVATSCSKSSSNTPLKGEMPSSTTTTVSSASKKGGTSASPTNFNIPPTKETPPLANDGLRTSVERCYNFHALHGPSPPGE